MSDRSAASRSPVPAHLKQASFASNQSFDPESYQRSSLSDQRSSFDPERLSFPTALSSQASYDPERDLVTAQTSYDPERSSMTSNTSYDPERQSVYAKSSNPEKSFDPERSQHSFASEASFDPERSVWGAGSSSATNSFKAAGAEPSIDPEASMQSLPSPRGGDVSSVSSDFKRSGKHLDHIAAMLRQAIKGDAPESLTQQSIDGDEVEGSRVCSTVMSFDPERGSSGASGGSSREKSFGVSEKSFDPEASQAMSGKMSEKSFDPEASNLGLLAGPSYDPSTDFAPRRAAGSVLSADEFDPERLGRQSSVGNEKSFDPETEALPTTANAALVRGPTPMRALRAAAPAPATGTAEEFAQLSPPGGQGRTGASICAVLSEEGGKFLIRKIWDDAQSVARIGDEVVKVNGLDLHGMTLDEVADVLEGPPGTLVDLDLRTTMGAPKQITLSRKDMAANRDSAASGGALGELSRVSVPTMYSPPSGGFSSGDQASMIEHFEEHFKTLRREAADKDRVIEDLRAQLGAQRNGTHGTGMGGGEDSAQVRAVLMAEMKKALAAKDQEIKSREVEVERLRGQVQQAAEFNDRMHEADEAKDLKLQAVKAQVEEQAEAARAASAARDDAEARAKTLIASEARLLAEREQLQRELRTLQETQDGDSRDRAHVVAAADASASALTRAREQGAGERMVAVCSSHPVDWRDMRNTLRDVPL